MVTIVDHHTLTADQKISVALLVFCLLVTSPSLCFLVTQQLTVVVEYKTEYENINYVANYIIMLLLATCACMYSR